MKPIHLILSALVVLGTPQVSSSLDTSSVAALNHDAAAAAFKARDWEEAARLLQPMAEENPYSGRIWSFLAGARYGLQQWSASADAYDRAAELGFQRAISLYNSACCRSLLGETDRAIDTLERALRGHFGRREELLRTDTDLDNIRNMEAFHERILPRVPEDISRVDGWNVDLDYLHRRMEETHYDLYRNISREEWARGLDRIRASVSQKEDHEIIVDLMALFARIGDGHTGVVPPIGGMPERPSVRALEQWHAIPVDFYIFTDGLFVRSAESRYASVVGKRVKRVGKLSAADALERCASVTQRDNTQQIKWIAPRWMSAVEVLHGLGIIENRDHVDLVVADAEGQEEKVRIEPVPFDRNMMSRNFAEPVTMIEGPTPMYLRDREQNYWYEYLEDERLVYFQFNAVMNEDEGESLADFSARLFDFINKNEVDALVIDVRLNHGGNNFLVAPIIDAVVRTNKINEKGKLFMIIGRETFSACQNFTNRMQRETEVMFVGEPTGSSPNFVGEGNPIWLPWSGLTVRGSSRYWQDSVSEDARPWVAPDLVAELSSQDYRLGHDPAMATLRAYLQAHREFMEERAAR
ncbi:MAG: hypothetical protein IH969_04635 [Candidatus Krumholzibacteriota bacterium]|nr:hypothetical protein [Candidatus Krumholzibacteriota bacterium]